ncbi:MAG: hypothetical protein ACOH2M_22240 [Cypionkella sp.]
MKQVLLAIVLIAVPVTLFSGFQIYSSGSAQAASSGLGDMSAFKTIIGDVQALTDKGDMAGAAKRVTDFETAWDQAETAIRPMSPSQWANIDQAADGALKAVRASTPAPDKAKAALARLMAELNDPSKTS